MECPFCHYVGPTDVKRKPGPLLYKFLFLFRAALVCILFFILTVFAFILLCIPAFKRPYYN